MLHRNLVIVGAVLFGLLFVLGILAGKQHHKEISASHFSNEGAGRSSLSELPPDTGTLVNSAVTNTNANTTSTSIYLPSNSGVTLPVDGAMRVQIVPTPTVTSTTFGTSYYNSSNSPVVCSSSSGTAFSCVRP